eukprot:10087735-Heterocapsa_arctica.AAC.1
MRQEPARQETVVGTTVLEELNRARLRVDEVDRVDHALLSSSSKLRDVHGQVEEKPDHDQWDTLVAILEARHVLELWHQPKLQQIADRDDRSSDVRHDEPQLELQSMPRPTSHTTRAVDSQRSSRRSHRFRRVSEREELRSATPGLRA